MNSALLSGTEKLKAEKLLNEKYEVARKEFSSDESEVYKQGNSLLIHLKGMELVSGKDIVTPKGHTDSIGGKIINDKLSQNRASSVKQYLQSNDSGTAKDSTRIEAVGYGYQNRL